MSPIQFVEKWGPGGIASGLNERAGAQAHFLDLCEVLEVDGPADPNSYCFERGIWGVEGGRRFADVWKKGFFAWEYKAPGGDLRKALSQLMQYALPLDNPPLLVVSDRSRIEIHTHFTGCPSERHLVSIEDLRADRARRLLRNVFEDCDRFRPSLDSRALTADLAASFAGLADQLRTRGVPPIKTAHFLTQCVFCCFAEDAKLLKNHEFRKIVQPRQEPARLQSRLAALFGKMQTGGDFGADVIPWFNGGLFAVVEVPLLLEAEARVLSRTVDANWHGIDPTIFGTLFERGLDPTKRSQIGAHFTDAGTIEKLIDPVVRRPLLAEWGKAREEIFGLLGKRDFLNIRARGVPSKNPELRSRYAGLRSRASAAHRKAERLFSGFLERLRNFRVLDPACGSGNFLYLALKAIKDVEARANHDAELLGLDRQFPVTGPQNVLGIEINEYAAELARATIWIGELQWMQGHGLSPDERPLLKPLNQIECRDALLNQDGTSASWPLADVVVGNPPFIGNKKMREDLGNEYTVALRGAYAGSLTKNVDLVCYWFHKAREAIREGRTTAAGLVGTQAVRHGSNRAVLDAICRESSIFRAWSDEPWINEGAAVRVSLICFGDAHNEAVVLDGVPTMRIAADLSGKVEIDLTTIRRLKSNAGVAFQGSSKVGPFEVPGALAREWLVEANPNGRSNADVLRPWANGQTLTRRPGDDWIIDFGTDLCEEQAGMYEKPFEYVRHHVKPERARNNREAYRRYWWRHAEARAGLRQACAGLSRVIATPRVAKHRFFVWLDASVLPDTRLYVVARDDDLTFGVLSSRIHEVWALANASRHGVGNDPTYNAASCFETFPFPRWDSGDANLPHAPIRSSAVDLHEKRTAWLNPPEWTHRVPEVKPTGMRLSPYPERIVPKRGWESRLSERTMTRLYNERPAWLQNAHRALDYAVAAAYGWKDYTPGMPDEEILSRLLKLNLERATSMEGIAGH